MPGNDRVDEVENDTGTSGAILVLGMHRSGTSCLTGSLQRRGLFLGEVQERNPHNARGNRESRRIMALNDAVLAHSGGAWDRPPAVLSWSAAHAAERDCVVETLQSAGRPWGFKDLRTLLVLPFWLEGIRRPAFVGAFRHPVHVAASLYRRSRMPAEQADALWLAYNRRLLDLHRRTRFPLVSFDLDDAGYSSEVDRAARLLGLAGFDGAEEDFFEPNLRGGADDPDSSPRPSAEAMRVYAALMESAGETRK
jgi:hypothetical protein